MGADKKHVHNVALIGVVASVLPLFLYYYSQDRSANLAAFPDWIEVVGWVCLVTSITLALLFKRHTCTSCRAYAGTRVSKYVVSSRPTHARIDGGADRRYKHNPMINTYLVTYRCGVCQGDWSEHVEGT